MKQGEISEHCDFKVNNEADISGTSLQGKIEACYSDLVRLFGEPGPGDACKVSGEWAFELVGSEGVVTLYDYKETALYEDYLPTIEEFRAMDYYDFHIGAQSRDTAKMFYIWLRKKLSELKDPQGHLGEDRTENFHIDPEVERMMNLIKKHYVAKESQLVFDPESSKSPDHENEEEGKKEVKWDESKTGTGKVLLPMFNADFDGDPVETKVRTHVFPEDEYPSLPIIPMMEVTGRDKIQGRVLIDENEGNLMNVDVIKHFTRDDSRVLRRDMEDVGLFETMFREKLIKALTRTIVKDLIDIAKFKATKHDIHEMPRGHDCEDCYSGDTEAEQGAALDDFKEVLAGIYKETMGILEESDGEEDDDVDGSGCSDDCEGC